MRIRTFLAPFLLGGIALAAYTAAPLFQEAPVATSEQTQLLESCGEWAGTITSHDMGEPMSSPCTESIRALGQNWTVGSFKSSFMGMPFEGMGTMGFDTVTGKYRGTWVDNMSTFMAVMDGEWDEAKKAIVMHYDMRTPTGEMQKVRSESVNTADTYSMKFYDITSGEDSLMMEIDMKRTGKAVEAGMDK